MESSRADARTGRLADPGSGGGVDEVEGPAVAGEVAGAAVDASCGDGDAVVSGPGLVADEQPATSRPATIVVATRESDEGIRCSPTGV